MFADSDEERYIPLNQNDTPVRPHTDRKNSFIKGYLQPSPDVRSKYCPFESRNFFSNCQLTEKLPEQCSCRQNNAYCSLTLINEIDINATINNSVTHSDKTCEDVVKQNFSKQKRNCEQFLVDQIPSAFHKYDSGCFIDNKASKSKQDYARHQIVGEKVRTSEGRHTNTDSTSKHHSNEEYPTCGQCGHWITEKYLANLSCGVKAHLHCVTCIVCSNSWPDSIDTSTVIAFQPDDDGHPIEGIEMEAFQSEMAIPTQRLQEKTPHQFVENGDLHHKGIDVVIRHNGKFYCDYHFKKISTSTRCLGCQQELNAKDFCQRAGHFSEPFHISCFTCNLCHVMLTEGVVYGFTKDGRVLCHKHAINEENKPVKEKRSRTQFTEHQNRRLGLHFAQNPFPGVKSIEAIANELRLPKKVVQVWFQNSRSRNVKKAKYGNYKETP